jgi:hypothetical protein
VGMVDDESLMAYPNLREPHVRRFGIFLVGA